MTDEQKENVVSFVIEYEMYTDIPATAVTSSDEVVSYTNPNISSDDTTGDDT